MTALKIEEDVSTPRAKARRYWIGLKIAPPIARMLGNSAGLRSITAAWRSMTAVSLFPTKNAGSPRWMLSVSGLAPSTSRPSNQLKPIPIAERLPWPVADILSCSAADQFLWCDFGIPSTLPMTRWQS